tara:strand:+ start:222 stop:791 length:570 start_codon:yes stop_codon:yes gene_type:complete
MIIDDQKKFVFISVAKTGSTSIRRRLGSFKDPPPEIYHMSIKEVLKQYPHVKDYFKFAFVRNPYDRIFSAYINLKYDGHPWATELKGKKTFREFIMDFKNSQYSKYIHLHPQSSYVKINGNVAVDYLGKFENLQDHFHEVEKILNLGHKKLFKHRQSSTNKEPKKFDKEMRDIICDIYSEDFESFGYDK